ncbi:MAG: hypothetical protein NT041_00050, partial [Candidatus Vogelbacteria bacterium]|nr:hypothetical protein [Candidatus Vogelbacteria bacterium]
MKEGVPTSKLELRRDELLARVESKVETIEELKVFAEVNQPLSVEELQTESDRQLELIKSKFSEKLGLLAGYKKVHSELVELVGPIDSIFDLAKSEEDVDLLDREIELNNREDELKKDTDVAFLIKVEKFFENLVKKRKETLELQKLFPSNKKLFYARIAVIVGLKDPKDLEAVTMIWSGYSLSLLCDDKLAQKVIRSKSVEACHFSGSVVNAISLHHKDWKNSVIHENNHNLEEMFGDNGHQYSDQL